MESKNCIVIAAHISDKGKAKTLENCINSIRKYSPKYPIILAVTGDRGLIQDQLELVDHYVFTSINSLKLINEPMTVYYSMPEWTICYHLPLPRYEYGFAELQKKSIGLQSAMVLGYENFLVINYDLLLLESGFIDYMFSHEKSVFFKFDNYAVRTSCDVYKLNIEGANSIINLASNESLVREFASKYGGNMLEDVIGEAILHYKIDHRQLKANNLEIFQLSPFQVLINTSYNEGAMAAVGDDGMLYLLVTNAGHPRFTLDNKLYIKYLGEVTHYDMSMSASLLHPICKYEGDDVDIVVGTSFGEFHVTLRKEVIENSRIIPTSQFNPN